MRVILSLNPTRKLWNVIPEFGSEIDDLYWKQANILWGPENEDDISFAVAKLLTAKRARYALNLSGRHLHNLPNQLLIQVLMEAAKINDNENLEGNDATMFQHWIVEVLHKLDEAEDVSEEQIARLEWAYLPILQFSKRPPLVLHKTLSSSPEFFLQVLSALYKPDPESGMEDDRAGVDTEHVQAVATQAYNLFRTWKLVPGTSERKLNEAAFNDWINRTRELCQKAGRLNVCDMRIGHVLAYAPADSDGVWPAKTIRNVIEQLRSRELENGLLSGIYNKRGVHSRGLLEGGEQERDLAQFYRKNMQAIELGSPRTAAVLDRIVTTYENEGRTHDDEAERRSW